MQYEPIKRSIGKVLKQPFLRITFYKMLDLLLLRAWHIKKELRKVRKEIGEEASALDAGSGFGQYTYYISTLSNNWNITGADIEEPQIFDCNEFFRKIGKTNRVHFKKADLTTYIKPVEYNLILSVDVMEHILDDVAVFKNFYQSLQQNGVLLISTPSDLGGSDVHDNHDDSFISEHVRDGYNKEEIKKKLETAGFSKVEVKYTYGRSGQISWKLSMKYPIIMLNKSKVLFIVLPFYYILTLPFCFILNYIDLKKEHKTGTGLIVKAVK